MFEYQNVPEVIHIYIYIYIYTYIYIFGHCHSTINWSFYNGKIWGKSGEFIKHRDLIWIENVGRTMPFLPI